MSDGNLVWFYREELEKIDTGIRSTLLLPANVRKSFIRMGVLEYRKGLDRTSGVVLSPKGREILNSYIEGEALESS